MTDAALIAFIGADMIEEVCPECMGDGCESCSGSGLVSSEDAKRIQNRIDWDMDLFLIEEERKERRDEVYLSQLAIQYC